MEVTTAIDHPAESAGRHRPAGLGHAHRPHRRAAGLRRRAAQVPGTQHERSRHGLLRRARRDGAAAELDRDRAADLVLRRPGAAHDLGRARRHARRGRRHRGHGAGVRARPALAGAAGDHRRGRRLPVAPQRARRPDRPHRPRPGRDDPRAAADHGGDRAAGACRRRQDAARAVFRRHAARRADRRDVRGAVLLQPGRGAAGGHAGRLARAAAARGAAAGARRQPRQRLPGAAHDDEVRRGDAPRPAGQLRVQGRRSRAGACAAALRDAEAASRCGSSPARWWSPSISPSTCCWR